MSNMHEKKEGASNKGLSTMDKRRLMDAIKVTDGEKVTKKNGLEVCLLSQDGALVKESGYYKAFSNKEFSIELKNTRDEKMRVIIYMNKMNVGRFLVTPGETFNIRRFAREDRGFKVVPSNSAEANDTHGSAASRRLYDGLIELQVDLEEIESDSEEECWERKPVYRGKMPSASIVKGGKINQRFIVSRFGKYDPTKSFSLELRLALVDDDSAREEWEEEVDEVECEIECLKAALSRAIDRKERLLRSEPSKLLDKIDLNSEEFADSILQPEATH